MTSTQNGFLVKQPRHCDWKEASPSVHQNQVSQWAALTQQNLWRMPCPACSCSHCLSWLASHAILQTFSLYFDRQSLIKHLVQNLSALNQKRLSFQDISLMKSTAYLAPLLSQSCTKAVTSSVTSCIALLAANSFKEVVHHPYD